MPRLVTLAAHGNRERAHGLRRLQLSERDHRAGVQAPRQEGADRDVGVQPTPNRATQNGLDLVDRGGVSHGPLALLPPTRVAHISQ